MYANDVKIQIKYTRIFAHYWQIRTY